MSRSDERELEALIRKNAAKAAKKKPKARQQYDDTLPRESETDGDSRNLFQEMKKREF